MFARRFSAGDQHLDSELHTEFNEVYQTILTSKAVRTDEEELALVDELVRLAEQGSFPQDGAMHLISPTVDVDWTSDEALLAVRPAPARSYGPLVGGLLIGGVLLFTLFSFLGGKGGGKDASTSLPALSTATAQDTIGKTTITAESATQTAVAQATVVWAGSGIVVGTDYKQKLPPLYPETLEIDGTPFRVYPSAIESGLWNYQPVDGTASWLAGTVINWSFGVPGLDRNRVLFNKLAQAPDGEKEALLRMSGGVVRRFRLQRPVQVERQQIEVFAQSRPGLSVALLGDEQGAQRWLLRGAEEYPGLPAAGTVTVTASPASLGSPVQTSSRP